MCPLTFQPCSLRQGLKPCNPPMAKSSLIASVPRPQAWPHPSLTCSCLRLWLLAPGCALHHLVVSPPVQHPWVLRVSCVSPGGHCLTSSQLPFTPSLVSSHLELQEMLFSVFSGPDPQLVHPYPTLHSLPIRPCSLCLPCLRPPT